MKAKPAKSEQLNHELKVFCYLLAKPVRASPESVSQPQLQKWTGFLKIREKPLSSRKSASTSATGS
jgi:hypothetical protein